MFSDTRRKTLRNRVIFTALGVLIMAFGIWLNYRSEEPAQKVEDAAGNVSVEEEEQQQEASTSRQERENVDEKETAGDDREGTDTESVPESYLIKEVEGVVKVFLCHQDGSEELYLITSIPFELLSENDQQLLSEGVEIQTEEDLGKFLENFDS